ncbi:5-oxoprolinase subunit PxpB [Lonepinella sp. MS14436]|uniref:5-oxoprolinase subunit PxpB n=1 Tax=Lonepinella sp. MS14436 TaxID=3003619 RepID=UPI0036DAF2D3
MLNIAVISENALVCALPPPAELDKQRKLWAFAGLLNQQEGICEVIVGMNNLTVFTALGADLMVFSERLKKYWSQVENQQYQGKHFQIPVQYGGEFGQDLMDVATFHKVLPQDIITRHTAPIYTVFMIGFQAGFPYLGGLPEHLHTPRREVPRTLVPAGSVGIGGSQTGIYPFSSPGGWKILGRTDLPLFDKSNYPPTLLKAGDTVQFVVESVQL